jgi:hypothetical protein
MTAANLSRIPWLRPARIAVAGLALLSVAILAAATWLDPSFASVLGWSRETYAEAAAGLGLSTGGLDAFHILAATLTRLGYLGMAALIYFRRPHDPAALFVALTVATFSVTAVFVGETVQNNPWLAGPLDLVQAVGQTCMFVFAFIFPDGRFVPRWMSWPTLVMVGAAMLARFETFSTSPLFQTILTLFLLWYFACIPAQIYRYRRAADPVQRQQIKWGVVGIALFALLTGGNWFIFGYWLPQANPLLQQPSSLALGYQFTRSLAATLGALALPVTLSIAILRYRLWDIDVLIRRTLIYSVLTALLALLYFGSVVVIQGLLRGLTGGQSQVAIVLSTLVIAALFVPLRARVQRAIDRRFFRR